MRIPIERAVDPDGPQRHCVSNLRDGLGLAPRRRRALTLLGYAHPKIEKITCAVGPACPIDEGVDVPKRPRWIYRNQ